MSDEIAELRIKVENGIRDFEANDRPASGAINHDIGTMIQVVREDAYTAVESGGGIEAYVAHREEALALHKSRKRPRDTQLFTYILKLYGRIDGALGVPHSKIGREEDGHGRA